MSKHKKFIFSVSLSVLISFGKKKWENPLIIKLLNKLYTIHKTKANIFWWILNHIKGGDRVLSPAISTSGMMIDDNLQIPYTVRKVKVNEENNNYEKVTHKINFSK